MRKYRGIQFDGLRYWETYSILYATSTQKTFLTGFHL